MWIVLNQLLNTKVVQYMLLALCVILLTISIILGIMYKVSNSYNKDLQRKVAETSAALAIQNNEIARWGEMYKTQVSDYKTSIKRATDVANVVQKRIKDLENLKLEGSCEEKLNATVKYINKP